MRIIDALLCRELAQHRRIGGIQHSQRPGLAGNVTCKFYLPGTNGCLIDAERLFGNSFMDYICQQIQALDHAHRTDVIERLTGCY